MKIKKINSKVEGTDSTDMGIRHLTLDHIDEINDKLCFVMAVLDAICVIGDCGDDEIKGSTLLNLASEAEEKMEKVMGIINA